MLKKSVTSYFGMPMHSKMFSASNNRQGEELFLEKCYIYCALSRKMAYRFILGVLINVSL